MAITSLAVLTQAPDGGSALRGYVSTRTSVFSFVTNRGAWTAQPVSMPPGTVREVWVEGGRARAGYEDGRIVTLPSRVPIAPEVSVAQVVDFVTACGQTWALTPLGLERLVDGEGEVGRWVEEPLPGAEAVLNDGLASGHLFFHDGRVFVFNAFGGAVSFEPGGCP